jgi:uncharacterized protein (TIGR02145 family)
MRKELLLVLFLCFVTKPEGSGTFTDTRNKQSYRTVKIGGLTWMAENLNYTTNNSWCYEDDKNNCQKYGRLYNLNAAMKACPTGWILPDGRDWFDLLKAVGGQLEDGEYHFSVAGGKLKSKTGWDDDGNGTDDFGFSALPGGAKNGWGYFEGVGNRGNWWSGEEGWYISSEDENATPASQDFSDSQDARNFPKSGLSVRCVWDDPAMRLTLTVNKNLAAGGTVTPAGKQSVRTQRLIPIKATPAKGYIFVNWTVTSGQALFGESRYNNINCTTASMSATVTLTSNAVITANFRKIPPVAKGTFTDTRDNQTYRTVKIDNKTWMAQNLNFVANDSWCYENENSNCTKYGRLYVWETATNVCPAGWRLPSRKDWDDLTVSTGGYATSKWLKSKTDWGGIWEIINGKDTFITHDGTDDFGFSAFPGGYRNTRGDFYSIGSSGRWWSSEEIDESDAYSRVMNGNITEWNERKNYGLSVRCVRE